MAAVAAKESEGSDAQKELEKLQEYAEQRKEKADATGAAVSAAMEAAGGEVPRDTLDNMPIDTVQDVMKAKAAEAQQEMTARGAAKKAAEAIPEGKAKDAALAAVAAKEAEGRTSQPDASTQRTRR